MNTSTTQPSRTLRLGTRASLLARAQSTIVAQALMAEHPGLQVELVELETRGDIDQKTPLTQVSDQAFFSDSLDAALADGSVDFCVHSWKDIDGPRPEGFVRAAVPRRSLPHDVILFRADVTDVIRRGDTLRIGTSSTRRQINTADFLRWALPGEAAFEFSLLRGPVHERVSRIADSAGQNRLDGVVLALAGLERLWQDPVGRAAIEPYLRDARRMVMPLSAAPAAAGQGALAVETLAGNTEVRDLLQAIHDPQSENLVSLEQSLIAECDPTGTGGFGATAVAHAELGYVVRLRGRVDADATPLQLTRTALDQHENLTAEGAERMRPAGRSAGRRWPAATWHAGIRKAAIPDRATQACASARAVFVAHADALTGAAASPSARYWTSGPDSWARLARQGIWIEGCADNLGFAAATELLAAPVLQLPALGEWTALTHRDALPGWDDSGVGHVVATYSIDIALDEHAARQELAGCTHFYWSSARQYEALRKWLPADAQHACGAGKTLHALRAAGLEQVRPFPSRREWQQWAA